MSEVHTGGCQCGAVRYRASKLGRASICHCRMCQKAFGGFFGPLVTGEDIEWTRGERARFQSSNKNWRGFCRDCGTPLTYEHADGIELAIGSLDNPDRAAPVAQTNVAHKRAFFDDLTSIPPVGVEEMDGHDAYNATIKSNQHPDHDTDSWPEDNR
ncbi:MAG: GFA family protein [Roseibium sp.]